MFALVDCNNFYVSCELVFNPAFYNRPVVVLSNNDGCIISRSQEAKALGLKMAEPVFKRKALIKKYGVKIFSSNYALYGDMSRRVMETLKQFSPAVEIYSIDESFLNLTGFQHKNIYDYGWEMKRIVTRNTGLPVGVGIAPTKTLAKIANHLAKKHPESKGLCYLDTQRKLDWALRNTLVRDIWGIGRNYAKFLERYNIRTAYDFTRAGSKWVRKHMTVVGLRTQRELLGESCLPLESVMPPKKAIATTRAFGKKISNIKYLREAVATYATRCAEKLRRQHSAANLITTFIHTDPFSAHEAYHSKSNTLHLPVASNNQSELVKYALKSLFKIYQKNYRYKKAGVIVDGLVDENQIQPNLFYQIDLEKQKKLMNAVDTINDCYGRDKIKLAIQGNSKEWKLKQNYLSKQFTTNWNHIIEVKI